MKFWPAGKESASCSEADEEPELVPTTPDAYLHPPPQQSGLGAGIQPLQAVILVPALPKGALVELQPLACSWDPNQARLI